MSVWIAIAQGILAAGMLAAVAYPFICRKEARSLVPQEADDLQAKRQALLADKHVAYEAIKELELDWTSGKLSDADYQTMRRELEAEAIKVLQKLDALEGPQAARPAEVKSRCPSCGQEAEPSHTFCSECGSKVA